MTSPPNHLLALAFARRTLLELGIELDPDDDATSRALFDSHGILELWLGMPSRDLDNMTPVAAFGTEHGRARPREFLVSRLAPRRPRGEQPAP